MARSMKAWWAEEVIQKLNPAQRAIQGEQGETVSTQSNEVTYKQAFDRLESVNRGVNIIVSGCSSLDFDVKEQLPASTVVGMRHKSLLNLLNFRPNPYQSVQEFRKNIFTDYILEGNIFIYYDGAFLYHLPASSVVINSDPKTFIKSYTYQDVEFKPDEIIHLKDLNSTSIYRGASRLISAERSISILYKMQTFQQQFFENNAVPGLVFTTENTLSQIAKDKTIQFWSAKYNPKNGARKPMILDSGLKPSNVFNTNFKEMDFDVSIATHDRKIMKALGVPPLLLDGGNNANIAPNLRLMYLETILPIVRSFTSAMERYFGYDIEAITGNISALQPDMSEVAAYHSTLVNGGIITANEARVELRYEIKPGHDDLRIPANIAGSAANPALGGAPKKPANKE